MKSVQQRPVSPETTEPASEGHSELKTLIGKKVVIEASDGSKRTGVLQSLVDDQLTLSVPVGAGSMEFFYDLDSIRHIEAAR